MPRYKVRRVHVLVTERFLRAPDHAAACARANRWLSTHLTLDRVSITAKALPDVENEPASHNEGENNEGTSTS